MKNTVIVGAGLAGLSAAVILAREGRSVTVLEQKKAIGGATLHASTVARRKFGFADMTPLDIAAMSRYLGFPLSETEDAAFCEDLAQVRFRAFGKVFDIPFQPGMHMKLVERGAGATSLDTRLYELAVESGVKFKFNSAVRTRRDFEELPPGSIVATGMFREAFDALGIPYTMAHGYFAGGPAPQGKSTFCVAYYHEHTHDYAYYASVNGSGAAMLFQRGKKLSDEAREWFPRQLEEDEGISFSKWHAITNMVGTPTASFSNPRLHWEQLILAGTLAGMQDPSMVLGVHGALVSGKIAAMAVSDPEAAQAEFARMNRWWKLSYLTRKLLWATHPWGPKRLIPAALTLMPRVDQRPLWRFNPAIPGWLRI